MKLLVPIAALALVGCASDQQLSQREQKAARALAKTLCNPQKAEIAGSYWTQKMADLADSQSIEWPNYQSQQSELKVQQESVRIARAHGCISPL